MAVPIPEGKKSNHSNSFVDKPVFCDRFTNDHELRRTNLYRRYRDCGDPTAADNLGEATKYGYESLGPIGPSRTRAVVDELAMVQ